MLFPDEELLGSLMTGHMDGGGYGTFVNMLQRSAPGVLFLLQAEKLLPRTLNPASVPGGASEILADFAEVVDVNPMTDSSRLPGQKFPTDRVIVTEEYVSREEIRRSQYYADFGRKWGGLTSSVGFVIRSGRDGFLVLAATLEDGTPDTVRDTLQVEMERLRIPVRDSFRFAAALHRRGLMEGHARTLEILRTPVALFDARQRLVYANPAMEALHHDSDIAIGSKGALRARDLANSQTVEEAVRSVLRRRLPYGPVPLKRLGLLPLVLYVVPLSTSKRPSLIEAYDDLAPAVAIFLFDPLAIDERRPEVLQTMLGLTVAEADLAILLVNGCTLKEAAEHRGVSRVTARNQLGAITTKLGLSRQSELVGLLTRLFAHQPRPHG